jgi:hypothetical protein
MQTMVRHFMDLVLVYRRRRRRFNGTLAAAPATPEKWALECKIGRASHDVHSSDAERRSPGIS